MNTYIYIYILSDNASHFLFTDITHCLHLKVMAYKSEGKQAPFQK